MKIKHKVIKEFQYLSPDKKIFILKVGTILEEYIYRVKTELIPIDKLIIDNNPEFFEVIDWKAELLTFMRAEKMPQPAQLGKKLIPFFEEMIMSSIQNSSSSNGTQNVLDASKIRELERLEIDLNSRERRIKDKEDEVEIRLKRVEKREDEYKSDLKLLEKREDEIRIKSRELTEKELNIEDKLQDLNERERNIDRTLLTSTKEIDSKYAGLQEKIDNDLKKLSERERELELMTKDLKAKDELLQQKELSIKEHERKNQTRLEETEHLLNMIKAKSEEVDKTASAVWEYRDGIRYKK